jgi:hypothetical protein
MADIYTSGTLTASTFIGQKYYVLVDGTRFDKSEYTLTLNPGSASNDPNNTIGTTGVANFSEQDSPETPNDYDWAALDTANSKFALHIEDYEFFDRAYNDILDGSVRTQFAIGYGNTNSEDPNYISQSQSDFNWIDADSIQISGSGLTKQIIVTDQTIKNTVIDTGYDYIQFAIMTDEVWVMDDFAVADVSIA